MTTQLALMFATGWLIGFFCACAWIGARLQRVVRPKP